MLSSSHLRLALLLGLDLGLHRFFIDRDLLVQLLEAIVSLLFLVLPEEALPIEDNRVDVRFLGNGDVEGLVPLVHLDIHLNGSVEEAGSH